MYVLIFIFYIAIIYGMSKVCTYRLQTLFLKYPLRLHMRSPFFNQKEYVLFYMTL